MASISASTSRCGAVHRASNTWRAALFDTVPSAMRPTNCASTGAATGQASRTACGQPKLVANWLMGEISKRLNTEDRDIAAAPVAPATLAALIRRVDDGTLSNNGARQVFDALWAGQATDVDALIEASGLRQMSDSSALEAIVDQVIAANAKSVDEFRAGKEKAFNALVGQAMKATRGKGDPTQLNALLRARLVAKD